MKPEITDLFPFYQQGENFLRILDFIKHKVLSGRQLGFLSKRSTVDIIIEPFEALLERKK